MFKSPFLPDNEVIAEMKQAPAGSKARFLADLPIITHHIDAGLLFELPREEGRGVMRVVTTAPQRIFNVDRFFGEWRRGSWACLVIESNNPSYPKGCPIIVGEEELRRATALVAVPMN